ncbi:DUF4112 domain-containing protein [Enemella sp. A6]|uniref:DUF4112 domain-containing protein n=1 Tax=Enemella sp. A6 TaxID=3440152 RepID=UPI003EB8BD31
MSPLSDANDRRRYTDPKLAGLAPGEDTVHGTVVPTPARGTRRLSHVMDELIRVPGTNFTIGADALLSFIPGVGDAAGTVMNGVVLMDAVRCRVPLPVLLRMLGNVVIDWAVGLIPAVGPFVDMAFRGNTRNLRLLDKTIASGHTSKHRGVGYVIAAIAMILLVVLGLAILGIVGIVVLLNFLDQMRTR